MEPEPELLQPKVGRAQRLDGVVMDVGGDTGAFFLPGPGELTEQGLAVHVSRHHRFQTPGEDVTKTEAALQRGLTKNLELAQQLGGVPMTFRGKDVVSTITAFAREYEIKVVVMGKSHRSWHARLLGGSILDRLLRESEGLDVVIVDV